MVKKSRPILFEILTAIPDAFASYLGESIFNRAIKNKLVKVGIHNLRDFAYDKHKTIDDRPFGGGPGMVLKIEPIWKTVKKIKSKNKNLKTKTILFSTRGEKLDVKLAKKLSKYDRLILICGRYEGVDERVAEKIADMEISIGDYVLSGGELPAMVLAESISRFLPGFLGKQESLEDIKGYYPVYTRPAVFSPDKTHTWNVPEVLTSGHALNIALWRKAKERRANA